MDGRHEAYLARYKTFAKYMDAGDMTLDEIAEVMKVSINTLRSPLYKGVYNGKDADVSKQKLSARHAASPDVVNRMDLLNKRWRSLFRAVDIKYGSSDWNELDPMVIELRKVRSQLDKIDPLAGGSN